MVLQPPSSRVLVVDDDAGVRHALRDLLVEEGYRVDEARSAQEALDRIHDASEAPCLVLLEWGMPEMNGEEFLQALHDSRDARPIKCIVMSTSRELPYELPHLDKPFELHDVLGAVAQACAKSKR